MAISLGFPGYYANVGSIVNRGFDITLGADIVTTRDWRWNVTVMGSTLKNKVLKLTGNGEDIVNGVYIIREGQEINTFYMSKSAGVDPTTGEQLYWAYEKNADGSMKPGSEYVTNDATVAASCKYLQGSRIPRHLRFDLLVAEIPRLRPGAVVHLFARGQDLRLDLQRPDGAFVRRADLPPQRPAHVDRPGAADRRAAHDDHRFDADHRPLPDRRLVFRREEHLAGLQPAEAAAGQGRHRVAARLPRGRQSVDLHPSEGHEPAGQLHGIDLLFLYAQPHVHAGRGLKILNRDEKINCILLCLAACAGCPAAAT